MARGRPKKAPAATTNRVLELRTKHGLTQQQLGEAVGHDSTWVYKVEAGKQSLTWENALLLGRLFREHPGDLYIPSRRGELGDLMEVARYLELMTPEERAAYALLARAAVVTRLPPEPDAEPEPGSEENPPA
jgi:DNA-binding XRE family transcriptional regulator